MALKPVDLAVSQYAIATKPTDSYEEQLYFSTQQALDLGTLQIFGQNSGIYTPSVPDAAALAVTPSELAVILDNDINALTVPSVVVFGTDGSGNPLSGIATFVAPGYSQMQNGVFPATYAAEVVTLPTAGLLFKTVTSVSVVCGAELAPFTKLDVLGLPSVAGFIKVGTKTKLDWDPKVPMPHAVQDGRNKGAFIKSGEIEEGKISITAKNPSWGDGLARINGVRVTGLVKTVKEDKVDCMHMFLPGMIITWKASTGESIDSETLSAEGLYEKSPFMPAH